MIVYFHVLSFFRFCKKILLVTSDVVICTRYTIFANTLNLCTYSEIIAKINAL